MSESSTGPSTTTDSGAASSAGSTGEVAWPDGCTYAFGYCVCAGVPTGLVQDISGPQGLCLCGDLEVPWDRCGSDPCTEYSWRGEDEYGGCRCGSQDVMAPVWAEERLGPTCRCGLAGTEPKFCCSWDPEAETCTCADWDEEPGPHVFEGACTCGVETIHPSFCE